MYKYEDQKAELFKEGNQKLFLEIRDKAAGLLKTAGAFRVQELINGVGGDTWTMLACVDRLVEIGEIREIPTDGAGQHRLFVKK